MYFGPKKKYEQCKSSWSKTATYAFSCKVDYEPNLYITSSITSTKSRERIITITFPEVTFVNDIMSAIENNVNKYVNLLDVSIIIGKGDGKTVKIGVKPSITGNRRNCELRSDGNKLQVKCNQSDYIRYHRANQWLVKEWLLPLIGLKTIRQNTFTEVRKREKCLSCDT